MTGKLAAYFIIAVVLVIAALGICVLGIREIRAMVAEAVQLKANERDAYWAANIEKANAKANRRAADQAAARMGRFLRETARVTIVVSAVALSACSRIERQDGVPMLAAPPIVVPPDARRPCVTAPKPAVDPLTDRAPEDQVSDMSASDRYEIKSCDRRRAAAVVAIDAAN